MFTKTCTALTNLIQEMFFHVYYTPNANMADLSDLYMDLYTDLKYGGPLGSSCAKARLVRPQEFCFDCTS